MKPVKNPEGPEEGVIRVLRGGGWCDDAGHSRAAERSYWTPSARNGDHGFRIVMVAKRRKT